MVGYSNIFKEIILLKLFDYKLQLNLILRKLLDKLFVFLKSFLTDFIQDIYGGCFVLYSKNCDWIAIWWTF